jgi:hypothetical protein
VVDRSVRERTIREPLASLRRGRACLFDALPLGRLCDLVAVDELRCDLREPEFREVGQQVTLERPVQIGDRLRRESFLLTCMQPLARELVERRLLRRRFGYRCCLFRTPNAPADVGEDVL